MHPSYTWLLRYTFLVFFFFFGSKMTISHLLVYQGKENFVSKTDLLSQTISLLMGNHTFGCFLTAEF